MIENVLNEVYKIISEKKVRKNRRNYNIFKVLEMSDKEVLMCRVLADFLNPNGMHGKGTKYLELFLNEVLHREDYKLICEKAHIFKEYLIGEDRRIDIVIETREVFIPIEVKIHAGEQRAQCYDYYMYAKRKDKHPQVVYLTKTGSGPSPYSMSSANGKDAITQEEIYCISFAEDICGFMQRIVECEEDIIIKDIAKQYRDAIKSFSMFVDEEVEMEIVDKMCQNEDYFRSMLAIEQAAKKTKAKIIYLLFEEFELQMQSLLNKYHLKKETNFNWYDYHDQATEEYFAKRVSTYPGINYVCSNVNLPDGIQLWFRIEIDNNLFAGLCLFDTNADIEAGVSGEVIAPVERLKEQLYQCLNLSEPQYEGWWVKYWYLPTAYDNAKVDTEKIPNFKDMNEAAISLVDEEKRRCFVQECITIIDAELKELLMVR